VFGGLHTPWLASGYQFSVRLVVWADSHCCMHGSQSSVLLASGGTPESAVSPGLDPFSRHYGSTNATVVAVAYARSLPYTTPYTLSQINTNRSLN
jgi:hypothetical protein